MTRVLLILSIMSLMVGVTCHASLFDALNKKHTNIDLDQTSSIAGIDVNNGIRDDIENFIDTLPDSEKQKNALRQLSQVIARATMIGATGEAHNTSLRRTASDIDRAVECIFKQYETIQEASDQVDLIQKITANTPERYKGYMQFNDSVSGFVISSGPGDYCND